MTLLDFFAFICSGLIGWFIIGPVILFILSPIYSLLIKLYIKLKLQNSPELRVAYTHYVKLCKANNIKVNYLLRSERFRSSSEHRRVHIPLPTSRKNLSITYHEIGHIMHMQGSAINIYGLKPSRPKLMMLTILGDPNEIMYECNATLWAIRNSPIPLDYKRLKQALQSYLDNRAFFQMLPKKLLKKLEAQMQVKCKL